MGAVVAAVADGVGGPGGPRGGDRGVDALVGIHRGVGKGAQGRGGMENAPDELVGQGGQTQFPFRIEKQVGFPRLIPHREVGMAAVARQVGEGFGHEGGPVAVALGDAFHHVFKEGLAIGGHQGIGVGPVHFKLAVGVFVVVLVWPPAQGQHAVANLADHVKAPHQGLLVIAGLGLAIAVIRQIRALGVQQKILALHPGFDPIAQALGLGQHPL